MTTVLDPIEALGYDAEAVVRAASPLRLPRPNPDGSTVADGQGVRRLIHLEERPVVLSIAASDDRAGIHISASATTQAAADEGLARARFWAGVDDDLSGFLTRFARDELIGASLRQAPWLRPYRRPMPFEVLLAAVCEQLITDKRARRIKIAITRRHGRRLGDLVDCPDAATIAALAPAQLERCGLAASRAQTLVTAAREVAAGRVDLLDAEAHRHGWRRLRAIDGIGPWTLSTLALHGQGHHDALPAGDHAYRIAVARLLGRPPGSKADEAEVNAWFERYADWRGVAGWHLLRTLRRTGSPRRS